MTALSPFGEGREDAARTLGSIDCWKRRLEIESGEALPPNFDGYYWVQRGHLKASIVSSAGEERIFAIVGGGAIIGDFLGIGDNEGRISFRALARAQVSLASREDFQRWLDRDPLQRKLVMSAMARGLAEAYEEIIASSFLPIAGRVKRSLLKLAACIGEPDQSGATNWMFVRVRQADVAALAGVSRESVVRVLAMLRRSGVLVSHGRGAFALDLVGLEDDASKEATARPSWAAGAEVT
jgi:CRP-like cAMP-binding protein